MFYIFKYPSLHWEWASYSPLSEFVSLNVAKPLITISLVNGSVLPPGLYMLHFHIAASPSLHFMIWSLTRNCYFHVLCFLRGFFWWVFLLFVLCLVWVFFFFFCFGFFWGFFVVGFWWFFWYKLNNLLKQSSIAPVTSDILSGLAFSVEWLRHDCCILSFIKNLRESKSCSHGIYI